MSSTEQEGFSAAEKAAMKERAAEVRAPKKRMTKAEKAEQARREVEEKIASFEGNDKVLAEKLHRIVTSTAPGLEPKTWYGMPAYARDGKVVVFLQAAGKFDTRYVTLGFNDSANLDDGPMWPTAFAITKVTKDVENRVAELVRRAAS